MTDIALDKAAFISLVVETFNIGMFTVMFAATIRVIVRRRIYHANRYLLPTVCLIWILSIAHWIINIIRAWISFIDRAGHSITYLANNTDPTETARTGVYVSITVCADLFMIYRCYIVWNQRWPVIVLPILSCIATAVSGYGGTHTLLLGGGIFVETLFPWITSFFCTSLLTNVLCTTLIAFRILQTHISVRVHATCPPQGTRVIPALASFIESAAAYSLSLLALLITYELDLNAQFIVLDITSSLIGITLCLIILRLEGNTAHSVVSQPMVLDRNEARVSWLMQVDADGLTNDLFSVATPPKCQLIHGP
ncbi:hypothetical protein B0H19DRAFT_1239720 [Mycena capillaripes]|nr:hypothetical protein B0H19DRAFT_1239720 [Mycena capillaripes]